MTHTQHVPNNLRSIRKKVGLRQREVAQALGLASTDRISRWENGAAVPHIVNLFKLAAIYGVPPQDLYTETWQAIQQQIHPSSSQPGDFVEGVN